MIPNIREILLNHFIYVLLLYLVHRAERYKCVFESMHKECDVACLF